MSVFGANVKQEGFLHGTSYFLVPSERMQHFVACYDRVVILKYPTPIRPYFYFEDLFPKFKLYLKDIHDKT